MGNGNVGWRPGCGCLIAIGLAGVGGFCLFGNALLGSYGDVGGMIFGGILLVIGVILGLKAHNDM